MNFLTGTFNRNQEAMTQVQISFSQAFPFLGKPGLKEAATQFDKIGAGHLVDEVRELTRQKLHAIENKATELEILRTELSLLLNLCDCAAEGCPIIEGIEQP